VTTPQQLTSGVECVVRYQNCLAWIVGQSRSQAVNGGIITSDQSAKMRAGRSGVRFSVLIRLSPLAAQRIGAPTGGYFHSSPRSTENDGASSRKSPLKDAAHATLAAQSIRPVWRPDGFVCLTNWRVNPACQGYGAGQGPGPGVKSKNPETVPENSDEVVVPVVLTTTTKSECAGTVNEYDAFGIVVPRPTTPLSPR
jgi:hypothetical protein